MFIPGTVTTATGASSPAVNPVANPNQNPDNNPAGNSDRLYGRVCLDIGEVLDLLDDAATVPGANVTLIKSDGQGRAMSFGPVRVEDLNLQTVIGQFGGGEYRVQIRKPGHRGNWKACRFIAMGSPATPDRSADVPPARPAPSSPTPANGQDMMGMAITMMTGMMTQAQNAAIEAQKQTSTLLTAMLQQKTEPRGLGELEGLIKIADRLARVRGQGDSEESGGMGEVLGGVIKGFLDRAQNTAPRPVSAPPQPMDQTMARMSPRVPPANAAALPISQTRLGSPEVPPVVSSPAAVEPRLSAVAPANASPEATQLSPETTGDSAAFPVEVDPVLALTLMKLAPAESLIAAMLKRGDSPDAIADVIAATLGDDDMGKLLDRCNPGEMTAIVIKYVSAFAPYEATIAQVEDSLRSMFEEETGDENLSPS